MRVIHTPYCAGEGTALKWTGDNLIEINKVILEKAGGAVKVSVLDCSEHFKSVLEAGGSFTPDLQIVERTPTGTNLRRASVGSVIIILDNPDRNGEWVIVYGSEEQRVFLEEFKEIPSKKPQKVVAKGKKVTRAAWEDIASGAKAYDVVTFKDLMRAWDSIAEAVNQIKEETEENTKAVEALAAGISEISKAMGEAIENTTE